MNVDEIGKRETLDENFCKRVTVGIFGLFCLSASLLLYITVCCGWRDMRIILFLLALMGNLLMNIRYWRFTYTHSHSQCSAPYSNNKILNGFVGKINDKIRLTLDLCLTLSNIHIDDTFCFCISLKLFFFWFRFFSFLNSFVEWQRCERWINK